MLLQPEKILVFSSESDDAVGLQIYRLLYSNTSYDLIFVEGDYESTREITDYMLPSESGEEIYVGADELIEFFDSVDNITVVEYRELGMFYDYDLGFEFTDEMIDEIIEDIEPEELAPEIREILEDTSYVSQDWNIINWEDSKDALIENLDFIIKSEEDLDMIEKTVSDSSEFYDLVYPGLFELLLYAGDLYDEDHVFARTRTKVFCIKTDINGPFPNLIYDREDIDEELNSISELDHLILDLDASMLSDWYEESYLIDQDEYMDEDDLEEETED